MADQGSSMSDLWKRLRFVFIAIVETQEAKQKNKEEGSD